MVCVTQVIVDMSVPPSPICHSVEMDVQLSQSELSSRSLMSPPDSSAPIRDSPSSVRTHNHILTYAKNICPPPLWSCFPLLLLVTGEQNVWLQYFGFLGCIWLGSPDWWSISRGRQTVMAVLQQPRQPTGRGRLQLCQSRPQHRQVFPCSWPNAPAEEEKGPDAAPFGLVIFYWFNGYTRPKDLHHKCYLCES